jgi:hypothetical protein
MRALAIAFELMLYGLAAAAAINLYLTLTGAA